MMMMMMMASCGSERLVSDARSSTFPQTPVSRWQHSWHSKGERERESERRGWKREERGGQETSIHAQARQQLLRPRGLMPAAGVGTHLMATWKMWQWSPARTVRAERGCYTWAFLFLQLHSSRTSGQNILLQHRDNLQFLVKVGLYFCTAYQEWANHVLFACVFSSVEY